MKNFKTLLAESFRSEIDSTKILKIIASNRNLKLENGIKDKFPIDHKDNNSLYDIRQLVYTISNIDLPKYTISEHELFKAYEDYALTILNRYFTSPPLTRHKMYLTLHKNIVLISDKNIKKLYILFTKEFGKKSIRKMAA